MAIKAVVFDVFETLVPNGHDLWIESFRRLSREQGLAVEARQLWDTWLPMEREFRRRRLDPQTLTPSLPFQSYTEVWNDCFQRAFRQLGLSGDPAAATQLCWHDLGRRPAFPETQKVLEALDGSVKLALLSNADRAYLEPLVEHHGWTGRFSAVLCSEEAKAYKPHPSIFHQVLERLGVQPSEALQVGDTYHEDVRGAKLVGMQAAWVNRYGAAPDPDLPQPDYQVQSLTELSAILDRAANG